MRTFNIIMSMIIQHLRNILSLIFCWVLIGSSPVISQTVSWSEKANPLNLSINSVAFRSDGQKVISGTNCHPASIRVFDVASANLDWDYDVGMTHMCIMGVTFSSNTDYIAAIEEFGNIFLFDNTGPSPVIIDTISTGTMFGFSTAISPDNDKVAVGCSDGRLKIFDISTGAITNDFLAHNNWVTTLAYSPDGNNLVTGGNDDRVRIWSPNGNLLFTCKGHANEITNVKVSPDNKYVVSSSRDHTIKIWDITSGDLIRTIEGHTNDVTGIDISPDGSKIVSSSYDSTCKIWNFNSGALIKTFGIVDSGAVTTVAWSPSGDKIVTGNMLSDLVMWDMPEALGVDNSYSSSNLKIFPNPVQDWLRIEFNSVEEEIQFKIYNELGQLQKVKSRFTGSSIQLETTHLPNGTYIVVFNNGNSVSTSRFMVLR